MIYTCEREDFELTIPDISVTEFTLRHAERLADKPALIDGPTGRTLTYAELATGIRKAATGLAQRGMSKGDVMGIYCPNIPEYSSTWSAASSSSMSRTSSNNTAGPSEPVPLPVMTWTTLPAEIREWVVMKSCRRSRAWAVVKPCKFERGDGHLAQESSGAGQAGRWC